MTSIKKWDFCVKIFIQNSIKQWCSTYVPPKFFENVMNACCVRFWLWLSWSYWISDPLHPNYGRHLWTIPNSVSDFWKLNCHLLQTHTVQTDYIKTHLAYFLVHYRKCQGGTQNSKYYCKKSSKDLRNNQMEKVTSFQVKFVFIWHITIFCLLSRRCLNNGHRYNNRIKTDQWGLWNKKILSMIHNIYFVLIIHSSGIENNFIQSFTKKHK
jgi:hypothetical protein